MCYDEQNRRYEIYLYRLIKDHVGWENWAYEVVRSAFAITLLKQYKFKRPDIAKLRATLNSYMPTRTDKETYSLNKEHIDTYRTH